MSRSERAAYVEQHCEMEEYLLKPMNCPHHIQIYASQKRSYRELPCAWPNSARSTATSNRASFPD